MGISNIKCQLVFFFVVTIFASTSAAVTPSASPGIAVDLDQVIQTVASERNHDPFKSGVKAALNHPIYPTLFLQAESYGSIIDWVPSVSGAVLALPFHQSRMKVSAQDKFDGWFDEYEIPNLIFVYNKSTLVTLIHELRHALHLGVHGRIEGNVFDQALQKNKRRIQQFHERLTKSPLDVKTKKRLEVLSTRLLETCSEVSAHYGDLLLAEAFQNEVAQSNRDYIADYKREFEKSYKALSRHPFSASEVFVEDLKRHLDSSGM